jgi:hypothetical protein
MVLLKHLGTRMIQVFIGGVEKICNEDVCSKRYFLYRKPHNKQYIM